MMNDVMIQKIQSIQRCVLRAKEEYQQAGHGFASDFSRQDAAILNITRACEQAIDLANVVIKKKKLGIPAQSREAFVFLMDARLISKDLSEKMQRMVGFRNIMIHEYQRVNMAVVTSVIERGLEDILRFTDNMMDIAED